MTMRMARIGIARQEGEDEESENQESEDQKGEGQEGEDQEGGDHEGEDEEGEDQEDGDEEGGDEGRSAAPARRASAFPPWTSPGARNRSNPWRTQPCRCHPTATATSWGRPAGRGRTGGSTTMEEMYVEDK